MVTVNAMGDACPIPVVKTKNAIKELHGEGIVETLVDNEIAVQNLTKMAQQKGYAVKSEKTGENAFRVEMVISADAANAAASETVQEEEEVPDNSISANTLVVVSSKSMGIGDDDLGATLIKGFVFALTQQETLPKTMLFYNGGAFLTCEGAPTLDDLKSLEAQGVEILTCGTCLNHYGLTEKLQVGGVTNMYEIVERMAGASRVVRP